MLLLLGGALAVVSGLLIALHTPWARHRVLQLALQRIAPDGTVRVGALDYDLLRRHVRLVDVVLLSPGSSLPYFTADSIEVRVPWRALRGELAFDQLVLHRPRFHVAIAGDGSSNFSGDSAGLPGPLPIGLLQLDGLEIELDDARYAATFSAAGLRLTITDADVTSSLEQDVPARLRLDDESVSLRVESGNVGWDGGAVLLRQLQLQGDPGRLAIDGAVDALAGGLQASVDTEVDLAAAARLAGVQAGPAGSLAATGSVETDSTGARARFDISSAVIGWQQLQLRSLSGEVSLAESLQLRSLTATLAGGLLTLDAEVPLAAGDSSVEAHWSGVELDRLASEAAVGYRVPDGARGEGELRARWPGSIPELSATLAQLRLDVTGERFTAAVAATLRDGTLNGDYGLEVADLGMLASSLGMAADLGGSMRIRGQLAGSPDQLQASAHVQAQDLRWQDSAPLQIVADVAASQAGVEIAGVEVVADAGTLRGEISSNWQMDRVSGELALSADSTAALLQALPAAMRPQIPAGALAGSSEVGLRLSPAPFGTRIDALDVRTAGGELHGSGILSHDLSRVDVIAAATLTDIVALTGETRLADIRGVAAEVGLGIDAASGTTVFDFWSLDADLPAVDVRLRSPARIAVDASGWTVEDIHVLAGPARLDIEGSLPFDGDGDLRATATGDLATLDDLVALYWEQSGAGSAPPRLTGALQIDVRIGGSVSDPRPRGVVRLADGTVRYDSLPTVSVLRLEAAFDGTVVRLHELRAEIDGTRLLAEGELPLAHLIESEDVRPPPLRLSVDIEADDPALLLAAVPDGTLQAMRAHGRLEITASALHLEAVEAELVVDRLEVVAGEVGFAQAAPTRVRLRDGVVTLAGTRVAVVAGAAQRELAVGGEVRLLHANPMASAVTLRATGSIDLSDLQPWLPEGYRLGGVTEFELDVDGTLEAPRPYGEIRFRGGSLAVAEPRLRVSDLVGSVRFDGTTVSSEGIRGQANGGDVLLLLEADLGDAAAPRAIVGLTARGIALEAAGLRAGADVDLTLSARGADELRLFGEVRITDGGYRTARSLGAELVSMAGSGAAGAVAVEESGSLLERLIYDIRVRTEEDIIVDTSYAEIAVGAEVRVVGSGSRPGLVGQLQLAEGGQVFLVGNTYNVDRGLVTLADPTTIAPRLDIEASTRIGQYDINLAISGAATSPSVAVRSYPSLSEADIYSLMTTGRTLADARESGTQVLAEQAWSALTGQLQGAARSLGFSAIRFEQAQDAHNWRSLGEPDLFPRTTDLAARLTITRPIGSRFELTYSQSLTQTQDQSWVGSFRLPRDIQIRAGTYEDGSRVFEARHRLVFGAPWRESGRRAERPRVASVTFSGDPGMPEARLRGAIRLEEGKRFDFVDWRRDIEGLHRLYGEEGYLEARIRAIRKAAAAVELEYAIERGPRTQLRVEGFDFDDRFRRQAHTAWQDSVAIDFLLTDLQLMAERELARLGYVTARAEVTLAVDTDEDREILLRAMPGTRFDKVALEVRGAGALSPGELRDSLARAGLERGAWYEPNAVTAEIAAAYRQAGHPLARARVLEPTFAARTATAVIEVDEGPADRVAAIAFQGLRAITADELHAAAGLQAGDLVDPARLVDATAAIAAAYLRLGYNSATITHRSTPSEAGSQITFVVVEGAQQIVGDIQIVGRRRTRLGVVQRAIRIEVGEPLQLVLLEDSRRALLATEALQSAAAAIESMGETEPGIENVRVIFTLQEKALAELRYGVQLLSESGSSTLEDERTTRPGVSAILSHGNFLGVGATASLMASYRSKEPFGRASLVFPRLFGLPIRTLMLAQKYRRVLAETDTFSVRQDVTRWLLEQRLERGPFKVGYSYSWETSNNEILDPDFPFDPDPITVTRLVPTLIWDVRDDRFEPRRGAFHSSTYDLALAALGSQQQFHKYYGQQQVFVPVGPVVLATSVRFGAGRSLDEQSDSLPEAELFRVGGATTVRGYPDESLGRTEFFGAYFPGGDAALILNQEVRFPIAWWFHGVVFADGGYAFDDVSRITFGDLRWSTGAGLRLVSPYLTLRIDYGIRLDDVEYLPDLPRGRFHFGIGHIF